MRNFFPRRLKRNSEARKPNSERNPKPEDRMSCRTVRERTHNIWQSVKGTFGLRNSEFRSARAQLDTAPDFSLSPRGTSGERILPTESLRFEPLNPTTPLPALSSPSEGEERVAAGRERSGRGGRFMGREQPLSSCGWLGVCRAVASVRIRMGRGAFLPLRGGEGRGEGGRLTN
jgi:hypothetical protein